jgi:hypothetical protein
MNLLKWLPLQLLHGQNKTMTIKALYPTTRPTLDLNFAAAKRLDPRITYTRASTGTFVGSNGLIQSAAVNQARFDHNPTTGESLGLLVEEARTNVVTYSEQIDNAAWGKVNLTVTANSITAPDGNTTADTVTANGVNDFHWTYGTGLITGPQTCSIFVKAGTQNFVQILWGGDATPYANFILSTGSVGSVGATTTASIQSFPNGWYRCTASTSSSTATLMHTTFITSGSSGRAEISSLSTFFYLWGAQVEAGSFPTSYIPTVASAVTRAADVASITGANFSSWYRQDEGTFLGKGRQTYTTPNQFESLIMVGGYPNRTWAWSIIGSINIWNVGTDGLDTGQFYTGLTPNVPFSFNVAQAQENNQSVAVADGVIKASATPSQTLYTNAASLSIGVNYDGHIARLTYYPVRLPDAQLQALTAT